MMKSAQPPVRLFETIAIKGGQILNIDQHNRRFLLGQKFLNCQNLIHDLSDLIDLPTEFAHGLIRCRVTYQHDDIKVAYFHYAPKPISSFKLVCGDDIVYDHKYDDRSALNELLSKKEQCDEIIILQHDHVTDCSIGNLIFLKQGHWYTPDTPLLHGTQRAYLLGKQRIRLATINKQTLWQYEKVMMINALNGLDESRAVDMSRVVDVW